MAIPAGASDSATVALFTVHDAIMTLKFLDADYVPPSPPTAYLVEYRFQVSVGADNADLIDSHLWFERDPASGLLTGAGQGRKPPLAARTHLMVPRAGNPSPSLRGSGVNTEGDTAEPQSG